MKGALAVTLLTACTLVQPVFAEEDFPSRSIDIISPFEPGGSNDSFARLLAQYIGEKWKVPANVLNKPGAKGIPATQELYAARPDGYTVLVDNASTSTILVGTSTEPLPFDLYARTFLGMGLGTPFMVLVPKDSKFASLTELLAEAKAKPETISYTSQGASGVPDYFLRLLFGAAGVDISKAPPVMVTGSGSAITMTAGGNVAMGLASASAAQSAIESGLLRGLAISSDERDPAFPDVPTTKELGFPSLVSWNGLSSTPGVPQPVIDKWNALLKEATSDPTFIEGLHKMGATPFYSTPEEMASYVKDEVAKVKEVFGTNTN
jgi:tripartite-type tricarboxylate transporter receptor subunit TctC